MIAPLHRLAFALLLLGAASAARAEGPLTIVAENNWFPYSAERDGALQGLAVDLVRAAYRAAGREVSLVSLPYARCLEEVEAGRELGCFDTIREPANEARFLFHDVPLFAATIVIVAPADATVQGLTPADLKGQNVAVTNGYTYDEPFQSDGDVHKIVVTSDLSLLRVVGFKRAPYGVIYDKVMSSLLSEHADELAGKVKIVGILSHPELYISFSKTRPEAAGAIADLDRGLASIKADGTYQSIEKDWAARFNVDGAGN